MSKNVKSAFAARQAKEISKAETPKVTADNNLGAFEKRFTLAQLENWKKQYGGRELILLHVGSSLAVLRPPTADDLGDYMTTIGTASLGKAVALIMEALWIDGDIDLIDDEDKFIAVFLQINNILEGKKADFFRF
ncbi:hypothetical protein [Flavobacterium kingsejongi]|uniref:Uncharacterized protein n=1 Tax=Flavobacterium kingsejongi TaxID=1678728 RepID=A0A2S1LM51_9FLAO|nr:hypothetical protein [Flavobacterium kingsejongi]AWG24822.1 hypothetical protein FK004_06055 [Flavobacterium kingsejongi]